MQVLALFAAAAVAQVAAQPPTSPEATFRAGVEVVRLDVRVTDADGRPVKDLRQDEVEVLENGRPRPVVLFQHVEEPAASFVEVAQHTVAGEVSTNRGAARGHLYVLIFDQLHLAPGNEQRVRQAAQRFVATALRPGDRIALYALPGPGPQINFTADTRRVSAALDQIHGTAEPQAPGVFATMTRYEAFEILRGNEMILQRVVERVQTQGGSDATRRVDPSSFATGTMPVSALVREDAGRIANAADGETRSVLARLADVLRPLRTIEGRKTVLFVSEGFNGDRLSREIEEVAAAAAESYSVVSALDANRREIDMTAAEPVGADQANAIHDRLSPLGSLAAETGGSLVLDAGIRADQVFRSLAEQSQDYYLVGFTPPEEALAHRGEYRRVTVPVKRSGSQVSTRTGFAMTEAAAHLDRYQALDRAMTAPFPQQGLPIRYTTYVLRGSSQGAQRVILSLESELPVAPAPGNAAADVVFVVRSASDGRVAASGHDSMALPAQSTDGATTGIGTFRIQFELPSGTYLMRAVVREPGGLVGSADRRFTVRALDGPSLEAGDLVLSTSRGELPVRPTAFTGDGLTGIVALYARTQEQLANARVAIDVLPIGENTSVVSGVAELREIRTMSDGLTREARLELPLQDVAPGAYLARARVSDGGDTVSEVVRELDVRSGRAPLARQIAADVADARDAGRSTLAREFVTHLEQTGSVSAEQGRHGVERLTAGDYAAAADAFDIVLKMDPRNAPAAFLLGWALRGAGQDRDAISAWRRAAFLSPTLVPAHLALVDIYTELSQPALAVQAVRAGLAALPQSPELLDRLARLESTQK